MTSRELLSEAANLIPRREAELLLCSITRRKPFELYAEPKTLTSGELVLFFEWLEQRQAGIPLEYLTHRAAFLEYDLYVDERVFIPRPETEELVLSVLGQVADCRRAFDLGTGSGAIALALAKAFPRAEILAVDSSLEALEVARLNFERHCVSAQIHLVHHDFSAFAPNWQHFDLVVSNPPYVRTAELDMLPAEVQAEPRRALDGGPDGTDFLSRIICQAHRVLAPRGFVALEIDPRQEPLLEGIAHHFFKTVVFASDDAGKTRFLFLRA